MDEGFLENFYNMDVQRGTLVSEEEEAFEASWNVATAASGDRSRGLCATWSDPTFESDVAKIRRAAPRIQVEADRSRPIDNTGRSV